MCGICGVYNFDQRPVDGDLLHRMAGTIKHRGPDADGFFVEGAIGLGMRRLSIIDLAGGHQPIYNEDRTVALMFNGEIYGYVELREELERRGHRFATRSDTETIVHAYEEYGERCVEHLVGMFAFAIWDKRARRLFVARDRLGEKPLFYTRAGNQLLFASELKCLLQHPGVSREISEEALSQYLTALYIPYPLTMLRDVLKLPPGHWMSVDKAEVRVERYWFPEQVQPCRTTLSQAIDEFRARFAEAVRIQMRSDVPVGAFLSAGLDSTSVVAYASRTTEGAQLKTFAVGFTGADWDERPGARAVARAYGTDHYDITLSAEEVPGLLPRLVWHLDEPMGDGSIVPVYVVSRLAREHVKVILNGAGGDELFAGYPRYQIGQVSAAQQLLKALPSALKQAATGVGSLYSPGFGHRVRVTLRDIDRHYYEDTAWFYPAERQRLWGHNGHGYAEVVRRHYHRLRSADPVNRLMFVDLNTYLSDDLLPQVDRMTMAVSLEGRVPFLDHRLVEWAFGLPSEFKLRDGVSKYILRQALSDVLPPDILTRPKRGFGPPFDSWFKAGLLDQTRQLLLGPRAQARGIYDQSFVTSLLGANVEDHRIAQQIWMLLVLETWFRVYVDGKGTEMPGGGLDELL